MRVFSSIDELAASCGSVIGTSPWLRVNQEAINHFALASGDDQWIHVDVEKSASGPFGSTICHGLLTLAIGQHLARQVYRVEGTRMGINYGLNRVRFPTPLHVNSNVRAEVQVNAVERAGESWQVESRVTTYRDDVDKPVCVSEPITRLYLS